MIDNYELEEIMDILENCEDEKAAVRLLKEFNEKTAQLGKLLMNIDESLSTEEWKIRCDTAKKEVDEVIGRIRSLE